MPRDQVKRAGRLKSEAWRTRIGTGVREARKAKGWTQQTLGDLCGVDWTTISNLERGVTAPDYATLETLADVLEVGLDELVGRSMPAAAPAQAESETESRSLAKLVARLNDRQVGIAETLDECMRRLERLEHRAKEARPHRKRPA